MPDPGKSMIMLIANPSSYSARIWLPPLVIWGVGIALVVTELRKGFSGVDMVGTGLFFSVALIWLTAPLRTMAKSVLASGDRVTVRWYTGRCQTFAWQDISSIERFTERYGTNHQEVMRLVLENRSAVITSAMTNFRDFTALASENVPDERIRTLTSRWQEFVARLR